MTEAEWDKCDNPATMLAELIRERDAHELFRGSRHGLHQPVCDRKLRLFAAGCCRAAWSCLTDTQARQAVEFAESLADDPTTSQECWLAFYAADNIADPVDRFAVRATLRPDPAQGANEIVSCLLVGQNVPAAQRAGLLRCIFDSPFRAETLCGLDRKPFHTQFAHVAENGGFWLEAECPACDELRTPAVRAVAAAVYNERRFHELPVLADALEEAGCGDRVCPVCDGTGVCGLSRRLGITRPAWGHECGKCPGNKGRLPNPLLAHLRSPGPHARGCWALDLARGEVA